MDHVLICFGKAFRELFPETEKASEFRDWITDPFVHAMFSLQPPGRKTSHTLPLIMAFANGSLCDLWCMTQKDLEDLSDIFITKFFPIAFV